MNFEQVGVCLEFHRHTRLVSPHVMVSLGLARPRLGRPSGVFSLGQPEPQHGCKLLQSVRTLMCTV